MKVTLNWLKDFIDIDLSPEEVAEKLTMAGLEVEDVQTLHRDFAGVLVGQVIKIEKLDGHKNIAKCRVDIGQRQVDVICGAPDVQSGAIYPLAVPGAKLADGHKIIKKELYGIESEGMLCSEAELGLTERADRLMRLPSNAPVGNDIGEYLGAPDVVFDLSITPNRPDCLSVVGIARELAAATGTALHNPQSPAWIIEPSSIRYSVEIADRDLCPRYSGRLLTDITVKPSPFWLAVRLSAVDIRAINNVVDITNYVMMELGHPLHAFDHRLLNGNKILVRTAKAGEKFTTLDEKEHILDEESLLICDETKPVALAGVMGGLNSEVRSDTDTVFLESAYFDPHNIRRTAKHLDIGTESSRRFERGVDPNGTVKALNRAANLLTELAGAKLAGEIADNYAKKIHSVQIELSMDYANKLLGIRLTSEEIARLLPPIELKVKGVTGKQISVSVPTFRPDLTRDVDIVEEIARLFGYDNIPLVMAPQIDQTQSINERVVFRDTIRESLTGMGLNEAVTLNLVSPSMAEPFLPQDCDFVRILNPLNAELSVFRPSLLISLLFAVAYNRNRRNHNLGLFKIGNVAWIPGGKKKIVEKTQVAGLLCGERIHQTWYSKPQPFDFFDVKGVVEGLLSKIGLADYSLEKSTDGFWDQASMAIKAGGKIIGSFGKIDAEISTLYRIKTDDLYAFSIDFDSLFVHRRVIKRYNPVAKFPTAPFDLGFVVDVDVPIQKIQEEIRHSGGPHLTSIQLFDYYKGEQIQKGKKSIAFSLTFSSKERTLNIEEVENQINSILKHLNRQFGAELRPS
jgi:phenylalanyl-tRNA synthetase beta chain